MFTLKISEAHLVSSCFTDVAFFFFKQIEGKTLHKQRNYNLLYCDNHFMVVVWNQTYSISEVCLYSSPLFPVPPPLNTPAHGCARAHTHTHQRQRLIPSVILMTFRDLTMSVGARVWGQVSLAQKSALSASLGAFSQARVIVLQSLLRARTVPCHVGSKWPFVSFVGQAVDHWVYAQEELVNYLFLRE